MKVFIWVALAGAMVVLVACGHYSEEEAIFIPHNRTSDPQAAIVDGREIMQLAPNSATNTEIKVLVARRPVGNYGYGPSQVDKLVQVSVAFKNLRTGRLSYDLSCTAGAKVKTVITVYQDGQLTCTTLYTW